MKILVTGGAGYIGCHTVKLLQSLNHQVTVLDNLYRGHMQALENCDFHNIDLMDSSSLNGLFKDIKFDGVIHFAARSLVGESVEKPLEYYQTNIAGGINLLQAMRAGDCNQIVFSSSAAVYGEPKSIPIEESHPRNPINPYGRTKSLFEDILTESSVLGIRSVCLRYFNAAGAWPGGEMGEDHAVETHLIPLALKAAMGAGKPLTVFGTDYPTQDGTCVRDYVHVHDLARAHALALDWLQAHGPSLRLNLGNEKGFSVLEILETASEIAGCEIPTEYGPRRAGDPAILIASNRLASETIKWIPLRSDIRTIISDAWAWHSSHPEGYGSPDY
ncbi:MAG: UDP-glucose 4-epimerase GalE [Candidatus Wallbacteria bacterium HGW-Wallbacteria-1]|jgi:UDP-glucose 4-epimerase|uniref:UDP-glucose 4-epimerase n=1 Tax=Candidatus Wallbacteria bacterium HGW-Wallbacteria-1 TaxID=2013854 RepID=A0A2N1PRA2_9BACT|nr:MAG: UDP-glucose 4-epimerase GalE [Candidatus Wallbacteria bacterium HGW-Wallbacteria-1]